MVHYLSCVMSCPPEGARQAAEGVLAIAYKHRNDTIRFHRSSVQRPPDDDGRVKLSMADGAPSELEVTADASNVIPAVYAILITFAGAAILHMTKKIGVAVGSTHDAENIATVKASEHTIYARIVLKALGAQVMKATRILTDNLSNQRVAQNAQSAQSSRFFLIRSTCLHQRITDGELTVLHVPDPQNPSDFLTKLVDETKTTASIAYASGKKLPMYTDNAPVVQAHATTLPDIASADLETTLEDVVAGGYYEYRGDVVQVDNVRVEGVSCDVRWVDKSSYRINVHMSELSELSEGRLERAIKRDQQNDWGFAVAASQTREEMSGRAANLQAREASLATATDEDMHSQWAIEHSVVTHDREESTRRRINFDAQAFSGWADNGASAPRTPRQICNDTCPPPSPPPSPPAAYDTSDESYEEGSVMSVDGEIEEIPDDDATAGRSASAPTPQQMGLLNFTERVALGYIARRKSEPSLRALCFSDSGRHGRPRIEVGWQYSKRIQWRLQWAGIGQGTKIQDVKHEVWTHKIRVDNLEQQTIDWDVFVHDTDMHRDRRNNAAEKLAEIQPRLKAHREQLAEARAKLAVMIRNWNVMALIAEMLREHQRAHEHLCHSETTSKWTR